MGIKQKENKLKREAPASFWQLMREATSARIALGRSGAAIPTKAQLQFQLDHAMARDAVHVAWDLTSFARYFSREKIIALKTPVTDRYEYLKRPDLGRTLTTQSLKKLQTTKNKFDIALVISDGLSALAVDAHAPLFIQHLRASLQSNGLKLSPLILVPNSRVAVSDEIGHAMGVKLVVMMIGERPGLSAVDSMAMYMTYQPKKGNTDEKRNCISNIRTPHGLSPEVAAQKSTALILESLRRRLSGVQLKDEFPLRLEEHADEAASPRRLVTAAQNKNKK